MDWVQYLTSHGVQKVRQHGNKISAICPFHADKNPSFFVFLNGKGRWHCFGCNPPQGGSLKDLMWRLGDRFNPDLEAGTNNSSDVVPQELTSQELLEIYNKGVLYQTKFLQERGITEALMKKYGIKCMVNECYVPKARKNFMSNVLFPVYDIQQNFMGFSTRLSSLATKEFWIPPVIAGYFWGENYIQHKNYVVLVEGIFDAIACIEHGIQTLALTGKHLNSSRVNRLLDFRYRSIYIFLDDDAREDAHMTLSKLKLFTSINIGTIVAKVDPDELTEIQYKYIVQEILKGSLEIDCEMANKENA